MFRTCELIGLNDVDWDIIIHHTSYRGWRVMVFNVTFNNISVISWRQLYCWRKPEMVIDNDCIASCKSIYHTITTVTFLQRGFHLWYKNIITMQRYDHEGYFPFMFRPFGFIAPKTWNYFWFWAYLMKVIPETCCAH